MYLVVWEYNNIGAGYVDLHVSHVLFPLLCFNTGVISRLGSGPELLRQ